MIDKNIAIRSVEIMQTLRERGVKADELTYQALVEVAERLRSVKGWNQHPVPNTDEFLRIFKPFSALVDAVAAAGAPK